MKIPYYPGCTLKTQAKNFEISALASAKVLGIELVELPRWNCCGTVFSLTSDDLIHHVAPIRNLIRVEEMNKEKIVKDEYRLVTLCSMCYNTLKRANLRIKENPEELKKINDFMYLEGDYQGKVRVVHFLEILRDIGFEKIKQKVKKPLANLKIAPYYGCMIIRPKEVAIDDPEDPKIERELFSALGAQPVCHAYRKSCCGSYQIVQNKYVVSEIVYQILERAMMEGAEAIVLSCPLCDFNMDNMQKEIMERYPEFTPIPILYFTQLMVLAFGLDEEYCGFDLNHIDPRPLLREKNLLKSAERVQVKIG